MTESEIHDLSVAYAQASLMEKIRKEPDCIGHSETIRDFLKAYHFAKLHIPDEDSDIDYAG